MHANMIRLIMVYLLAILSVGCRLVDRPEPIPAFIKVDNFTLTAQSIHGTSSSRITDCWVYLNDNYVGAYELPALVPIHAEGVNNIKIRAGIMKNGIAADRTFYPFYTFYNETMNLVRDSIYTINPEITYEEGYLPWIEDFEDPGFKFNPYQSDTTMFIVTPAQYPDLIEGNCGMIRMNASSSRCEMRTNEPFFDNFPRNLELPAYLELNFKCNHEFVGGILSRDNQAPALFPSRLFTFKSTVDETGEMQWRKTYLYLSDITSFFPTAIDFELYFLAENRDGENGIEIFVDNLKVFYRQ
jgi:hypothetical protein